MVRSVLSGPLKKSSTKRCKKTIDILEVKLLWLCAEYSKLYLVQVLYHLFQLCDYDFLRYIICMHVMCIYVSTWFVHAAWASASVRSPPSCIDRQTFALAHILVSILQQQHSIKTAEQPHENTKNRRVVSEKKIIVFCVLYVLPDQTRIIKSNSVVVVCSFICTQNSVSQPDMPPGRLPSIRVYAAAPTDADVYCCSSLGWISTMYVHPSSQVLAVT